MHMFQSKTLYSLVSNPQGKSYSSVRNCFLSKVEVNSGSWLPKTELTVKNGIFDNIFQPITVAANGVADQSAQAHGKREKRRMSQMKFFASINVSQKKPVGLCMQERKHRDATALFKLRAVSTQRLRNLKP